MRSKHRTVSSALLLVPCTLISSLAIGNSALNAAAQPRKNTIVFAVAGEPDDYHMDAVVLVDGKQLRTPYAAKMVRISIPVDLDVLNFFKEGATQPGALRYKI